MAMARRQEQSTNVDTVLGGCQFQASESPIIKPFLGVSLSCPALPFPSIIPACLPAALSLFPFLLRSIRRKGREKKKKTSPLEINQEERGRRRETRKEHHLINSSPGRLHTHGWTHRGSQVRVVGRREHRVHRLLREGAREQGRARAAGAGAGVQGVRRLRLRPLRALREPEQESVLAAGELARPPRRARPGAGAPPPAAPPSTGAARQRVPPEEREQRQQRGVRGQQPRQQVLAAQAVPAAVRQQQQLPGPTRRRPRRRRRRVRRPWPEAPPRPAEGGHLAAAPRPPAGAYQGVDRAQVRRVGRTKRRGGGAGLHGAVREGEAAPGSGEGRSAGRAAAAVAGAGGAGPAPPEEGQEILPIKDIRVPVPSGQGVMQQLSYNINPTLITTEYYSIVSVFFNRNCICL